MVRTRLYRDGVLEAENFAIEDISEHLRDERAVVWLDLTAPTPDDFAKVQQELGLHSLAVEDATSPHERAKLNHYASHLFLTAYMVRYDADEVALDAREVSAFVTRRALITVHGADCDIDPVLQRWEDTAELSGHGVAYLLYGLLDVVVDGQFDALQSLDQALDDLEDLLFEESPESIRTVQRRAYRLRRALSTLRKVALPMREVVSGLMRPTTHAVEPDMVPYYQDVLDHVLRVGEWAESLRDLVASILETNVSVQGNRMNNVMKKVTSWAAIIAVPTAVTGYYGQNIPFPGFEHRGGFITSSVLIVVLSVGLYLTFKRKDWL